MYLIPSKTTILSCIVGVRRLDDGSIFVFGNKPGERGSGVPGKTVGYMPQDISLYGDFTINETLVYFGSLYCMSKQAIDKNRKFLIEFLALPEPTRRVGTLSGGQQRRVSISVAMIHDPELLILDEPVNTLIQVLFIITFFHNLKEFFLLICRRLELIHC